MAVPKKKHSKSRRNRRRSQWKATAPSLVECTNCHQTKLGHRVCQHCGFYSDRQVKAAQ